MTFAFDSSSLREYGSVLMICAAQNLLQASPLSMAAHAKGTDSVVSIFHINQMCIRDSSVAKQFTARVMEVSTPLYRYKNVIAGYTHLYWGEMDILKLWEV